MIPLSIRVVLLFCLLWLPDVGAAADPGVELTLSPDRQAVAAGDDLSLKSVLTNASGHAIGLGYVGSSVFDLVLSVRNSAGESAPESHAAIRRRNNPFNSPSRFITGDLPDGGQITEEIELSDFIDTTVPGLYFIEASWRLDPVIRSNLVQIVIEPSPLSDKSTRDAVARKVAAQFEPATEKPATLGLDMDNLLLTAGDNAPLAVRLTNTSNGIIQLETGSAKVYAVEARDENGVLLADKQANVDAKELMTRKEDPGLPKVAPQERKSNGEYTGEVLGPKGSWGDGIILADYVDLSKPGIYGIQLWRKLANPPVEIRSNVLVVTVKQANGKSR